MKPLIWNALFFDVPKPPYFSENIGDRIIEIAAIKVKNKEVVDSIDYLINPARGIPLEAQQVNNITDEMVAAAPTAQEILPRIIDFIGGASLVGHNIKFDLEFLCYELSLCGRKLSKYNPNDRYAQNV